MRTSASTREGEAGKYTVAENKEAIRLLREADIFTEAQFIVGLDNETKDTLERYGVWAEKSMYGRKYMGVERTTVLVDRAGKVAAIWHKVKVPGHAEAVLEAVKGLPKA